MNLNWKPLSEYISPPYACYDPLVLLGWESLNAEGSNGAGGMLTFGVGWLDGRSGKWIDVSDKRAWPWQPTHFALICQDIKRLR